jgi:hypothetical protein
VQAAHRDQELTSPPVAAKLRLFGQQVREPWPLSPQQRKALVECVLSIVAHARNDRDRIAAARLVLEMERANLERLRLDPEGPGLE